MYTGFICKRRIFEHRECEIRNGETYSQHCVCWHGNCHEQFYLPSIGDQSIGLVGVFINTVIVAFVVIPVAGSFVRGNPKPDIARYRYYG